MTKISSILSGLRQRVIHYFLDLNKSKSLNIFLLRFLLISKIIKIKVLLKNKFLCNFRFKCENHGIRKF